MKNRTDRFDEPKIREHSKGEPMIREHSKGHGYEKEARENYNSLDSYF